MDARRTTSPGTKSKGYGRIFLWSTEARVSACAAKRFTAQIQHQTNLKLITQTENRTPNLFFFVYMFPEYSKTLKKNHTKGLQIFFYIYDFLNFVVPSTHSRLI